MLYYNAASLLPPRKQSYKNLTLLLTFIAPTRVYHSASPAFYILLQRRPPPLPTPEAAQLARR